jgi:hypothetical protein
MDHHGQISAEFIMIMGISIITALIFAQASMEAQELNTCMSSARTGVTEGIALDSMAVYPSEKFDSYTKFHPRLKTCSRVVFIGIKYLNLGYDSKYQKTKILIQIKASAPYQMDKADRDCEGDRITYYVRKNICQAFKTENLTNLYYNPAFSNHYYFTTSNIEWV